mmetsp:Transcript_53895/g.157224  ORF Transcript_53895/g.157224 Transcript_53895/m.157224 type:complete len:1072 (-) Transcript_53895:98-3313(-)
MTGFTSQVVEIAFAARTELTLFCLAFAAHFILFGNVFPRRSKAQGQDARRPSVGGRQPTKGGRAKAGRCRQVSGSSDEDEAILAAAGGELGQQLQSCAAAFQRGDHRGVLRCWHAMRQGEVPASRLAQVIESMQRLKKDSESILAEVRCYLKQNPTLCGIGYVNRLLEPLARSLDVQLVQGLLGALAALDLEADCSTYEVVMQMHFTTRSFDEVSSLWQRMQSAGVAPTRRTSLVLLKAALQLGRLDDALERWREVGAGGLGSLTASAAPRHIAGQLVDLACREHRVEAVLEELEAQSMPLSTEMLNSMLADVWRVKDQDAMARVERLFQAQGVEKNGRTYSLLVRAAGDDVERIAGLLDEIAAGKADCASEVAQAVLSACSSTGSTDLADRMCVLLKPEQVGQVPAILGLVRFYAEVGHPEKACKLYDAYTRDDRRRALVDARTERCVVAAALQCGRKDLATGLLEAAPGDTAKHISMIRTCASKGNLEEAMKTFSALEASGAELTHSLWNTALDACVECRDLRRAEALMQRMEAAKVADVVSYNTLIKAHLRQEHYERARALMDEMRGIGISPNHVTYNELINALTRSEREPRRAQVWDVVDEMTRNGATPNRITCSILLKSLKAKSPHADVVRTLELTDSTEEPMDEVLLSSVVEACVRVGKPALLSQRLQQLQGQNAVTVTGAHTFGSLIKAYGYAKDVAGAWRCWKEMRSQHVKPTSITIGCMVEAVVTNGDVDGGYELISSLLQDYQCREQVNAVVFGSVLKGYGRARNMERVASVFEEMLARGIKPSVVTYNAVIDACARNGQMERVPELLAGMRRRGLEPNLITYSTLIKGFAQKGDMPSALSVLEDLKKEPGCKPDEVVYNTLLDGCLHAGLASEGERLFAEMQKQGVAPSNYTLTVLVKLLSQTSRLDRVFELVEGTALRFRFRSNSHVYGALVQACLTAREPLRAAGVYERAARERQQLEPRTCHNLVRALLSAGYRSKAVGLLRSSLGLRGAGGPGERSGAGQAADDGLLAECLESLLGSSDAALAPALLRDLRAARPKARVDPSLERRVAEVARERGA